MNRSLSTRRSFLSKSAVAGCSAFALPQIVPASALGRGQRKAPSERIVMGCIGVGGKGLNNAQRFMKNDDVQIVAVCDVDASHLVRAQRAVNGHYKNHDCAAYQDFRGLVGRDDIEAVSIATPDHWHALTSIAAANRGQDVYCEKPLANSIGEGRAICDAVEKNQVVLQTGSHERSGNNARFACELVRNGRIGKLHTIRVNLPCSDRHHQQARALAEPQNAAIPAGFDYEMWLGHTAAADYTPERCHFWWRFILAYGGGEMTDRGAHVIDLGQLGGGLDDTGPVSVEAQGIQDKGKLYDAFWDYQFVNVFPNGVRLIGSTTGPRGVRFEGSDGWVFIHVHGAKLEAHPASLLKEVIGDDEIHLGRSPGHHRNFLDCVRSRETPMASAEIGHRTATICHLNNIAMRLGRPLRWNPEQERFEGDDEANKQVNPPMRSPWSLQGEA